MLHPLFSILVRRPDLLVDHASGYAALIQEEASEFGADWLQRMLSWAVAAVCGAVFLTLVGVALMLGVMLDRFHWMLVAAPTVMLLFLAAAVGKARKPLPDNSFSEVKAQLDRDVKALRSAA